MMIIQYFLYFRSQVQGIITRIATERGINMVMNADIRTCNVTEGKEFLVAMDGRTFSFDEAVWCTEVNIYLYEDNVKYEALNSLYSLVGYHNTLYI